ncbi:class I SAM-dependent methyltransferase [Phragmitibacter flavus]|uniref:Class I SAM-dependent methyltransferase n=1 Tax=Phragmitibacter flavus TaxID=2576071 RepID=A0A5R8KIY0_9BACT|nr:class I SAM-dependent methyltransferase [Phragmitibacter flavus]TLD72242.1 class I SAM-dependent methyltransferase [Phragmitibacter flavus]
MNFDRIAPHYRWLEGLLAFGQLQRARTFWIREVQSSHRPANILIIGEGNGRFLQVLIKHCPHAHITCVDSSLRMIELAQSRIGKNASRVQWVHANVQHWQADPASFDLIVTHFFFDCFKPDEVASTVDHLAPMVTRNAAWLIADFCAPSPSAIASRSLLALLYAFFKRTADVTNQSISPPDPWLGQHRFHLRQRRHFACGLLHSDWWQQG